MEREREKDIVRHTDSKCDYQSAAREGREKNDKKHSGVGYLM